MAALHSRAADDRLADLAVVIETKVGDGNVELDRRKLSMLFMLINRTRSDLSSEEFQKLGELAKAFYANIPNSVTLHADWAALDQSRTFALMETEKQSAIEEIQAPFRRYVHIEIVPVREINGWEAT
jgi:hypothetical protein